MERLSLTLVIALAATACGSSSAVTPSDASPDASPADAAGPPLEITGTVYDALLDASGSSVSINSATVCIDSHPEVSCGHSDLNGNFTMEIPQALETEQLAFVTMASGYLGEVNHFRESSVVFGWPEPVLRSDSEATSYYATDAGFSYPAADTGFVVVRVNGASAGLAGVTATISPATAKGAVYDQTGDTPDPTLPSTSANGVILFGNVTPGPFTVTVSAPGKTCPVDGFATNWASATNQVAGIVVAGAVSDRLYISCE